jgi:1,4-dihydroxy-2-naphthoate octaprenyltransferase
LASPDRVIFGSKQMLDIILIAVGVGCFAIAIAYTYACDRL